MRLFKNEGGPLEKALYREKPGRIDPPIQERWPVSERPSDATTSLGRNPLEKGCAQKKRAVQKEIAGH